MKLAVYVEGAISQFVLTLETKWEKETLGDLAIRLIAKDQLNGVQPSIPARIYRGGFYEWRGGWVREGTNDSLISPLRHRGGQV